MGKRSRRMVVWMVAVPIVILLLALAGANWKTFHLAYAKHLISRTEAAKQKRGIDMVLRTHVQTGMGLEEVRRLLAPARLSEAYYPPALKAPPRYFGVLVKGSPWRLIAVLEFDGNDKLRSMEYIKDFPKAIW